LELHGQYAGGFTKAQPRICRDELEIRALKKSQQVDGRGVVDRVRIATLDTVEDRLAIQKLRPRR
jgi:hypothetical protein